MRKQKSAEKELKSRAGGAGLRTMRDRVLAPKSACDVAVTAVNTSVGISGSGLI